MNTLYDLYRDSLVSRGVQDKKFFVGYNSFRIILNTISRPGSYNQSLSYFYVDLLNCISTLKDCIDRLIQLASDAKDFYDENSNDSDIADYYKKSVLTPLNQLTQQVNFISTFLRHEYYSSLQSTSEDLYTCVNFALGDKTVESLQPQPNNSSQFLVALLLEMVFVDVIKTVVDFVSNKTGHCNF